MQVEFDGDVKTLPLQFEKPLVIVGGGTVDLVLLASLSKAGAGVVAADGGAMACGDAGVIPDAIIGDMDSLDDQEIWGKQAPIFRLEEQITTDFEKCLYSTSAPVTVVLGMTGKRFDHTLAALHVVTKFAAARKVILVDEVDLAMAICGPFSFAVGPGERVSMHPLASVRFARSAGLKYPLDGLTLAPGGLSGTSNEATDGQVFIEPSSGEDGAWLLILARNHLDELVAQVIDKT